MTQSDPGGLCIKKRKYIFDVLFTLGSLPVWLVNKLSKVFAPKVRLFYLKIESKLTIFL